MTQQHETSPVSASLGRVVAIANGKGGVLKTSLAANIAGLSAKSGTRTLLIELDAQGDLADDLGCFDDPRMDQGEGLSKALLFKGEQLRPNLVQVRENLDLIGGGEYISQVSTMLKSRHIDETALARELAPLAEDYDLILIDTPPIDEELQLLALTASRWLLAPTKSDTSSIRAIATIVRRAMVSRLDGHPLDVLGVVLTGTGTSATRVRADAEADIKKMLGDVAPLFDSSVRHSESVARTARQKGLLVHELAEEVVGAEPFWQSLKLGNTPQRLPGAAPALADDYIGVTHQMLTRIAELEGNEE